MIAHTNNPKQGVLNSSEKPLHSTGFSSSREMLKSEKEMPRQSRDLNPEPLCISLFCTFHAEMSTKLVHRWTKSMTNLPRLREAFFHLKSFTRHVEPWAGAEEGDRGGILSPHTQEPPQYTRRGLTLTKPYVSC